MNLLSKGLSQKEKDFQRLRALAKLYLQEYPRNLERVLTDLKSNVYPKQKQFIESDKRIKLFIGGNRSGKTTTGIIDIVLELVGKHPLQDKGLRPKPPLYWRACSPDFPTIDKVLAPEFKHWIPKDCFEKYDSRNKILYCKENSPARGSKVDFLSYEQELEKFGAAKRHGIMLDEESYEDQYNESLMRLIDYKGRVIICMTPIKGMTWVFDRIWLPSLDPSSDIFSVKASIWDNPYISAEEKENILKELQGEERRVREYGDWVEFAGLVWPEFKNDYVENGGHITNPFPLPEEGTIYMAIDPMDRVQAVLWLKVLPSGRLIFFDELLTEDLRVEEVARIIKEKEKLMGYIDGTNRFIDWNASREDPVSGQSVLAEYARFDICCSAAVKDWVLGKSIGKEYWNARDTGGRPLCVVFSTLKHFRRQLVHYVHSDYKRNKEEHNLPNKPKKRDDHLPDCARYLFAIRPKYTSQQESMERVEIDHLDLRSARIRRGEE